MDSSLFEPIGKKAPIPVGLGSTVPERLNLGHAAPGPGRARRARPRDLEGGRGVDLPTGLVAPAVDGCSMSYHHEGRHSTVGTSRKIKNNSALYFMAHGVFPGSCM